MRDMCEIKSNINVGDKAISENREHTKAIVNLLIYDKV